MKNIKTQIIGTILGLFISSVIYLIGYTAAGFSEEPSKYLLAIGWFAGVGYAFTSCAYVQIKNDKSNGKAIR